MSSSRNALRVTCLVAAAMALLLLSAVPSAFGARVLDPGFGKRGWYELPGETIAKGVAIAGMVQVPDGDFRVFGQANGDLGVFAYESDGSLDTDFHGRGWRLLEPVWKHGADWDMPRVIARHGRDHSLVAGAIDYVSAYASYRQQTISRIGDNGKLDRGFGDHGTVRIARLGWALDIAVDSKQRIITLSRISQKGGRVSGKPMVPPKTEITRFLPDGRLDRSFGKDGTIVRRAPGGSVGHAVEVDSKNRVISLTWDNAGTKAEPEREATLARYLGDGRPDISYGNGGTAEFGLVERVQPSDFIMLPGDRTLMGGERGSSGALTFIQHLPSGKLDTRFGDGGIRSDYSGVSWKRPHRMTLLQSGDIAMMLDQSVALFRDDGTRVEIDTTQLPRGILAAGSDGSLFTAGGTGSPVLGRVRPDLTTDESFTQNSLPQKELRFNEPEGLYGLGKLADGSLAGAVEVGTSKYYGTPGIFHLSKSGKADRSFGNDGLITVDQRFISSPSILPAPRGKVRLVGSGPGEKKALRFDLGRNGRIYRKTLPKIKKYDFTEAVTTRDGGFIALSDTRRKKRGERSTNGFSISRFTAGSKPARFGKGGQAKAFFGLDASPATAFEDGKGRVVVAGGNCFSGAFCTDAKEVSQKVTFARFLANGKPDRSFGNGGKVQHAFGTQGAAWHATALPDGRIAALVGNICVWNCFNRLALMVIRPDGSLDRGFGGDGKIVLGIGRRFDPVKLFPAGRSGIDLVASVEPCGADPSFGVLRIGRNGLLDSRFGGGDGLLRALPGAALEANPYFAVKQSRGTLTMGGPIAVPGRYGGTEATSGIARIQLKAKDGKESLKTCGP